MQAQQTLPGSFLILSPIQKQSHWVIETLGFLGDSLRIVVSEPLRYAMTTVCESNLNKARRKKGRGKGQEGRDGKKRDAEEGHWQGIQHFHIVTQHSCHFQSSHRKTSQWSLEKKKKVFNFSVYYLVLGTSIVSLSTLLTSHGSDRQGSNKAWVFSVCLDFRKACKATTQHNHWNSSHNGMSHQGSPLA